MFHYPICALFSHLISGYMKGTESHGAVVISFKFQYFQNSRDPLQQLQQLQQPSMLTMSRKVLVSFDSFLDSIF